MKIHRMVFCLGAITITILAGGFTQAQEKPVVMVADFELVGVPAHLKASLSGRLQAGVAATGKYRTTDPTVTRKALSEQARQQKMTDCYAEECLARVGKALGASEMIVGTITKVKERFYTVDLKLVDIALLTSMNTVSESSRGDIEATYEAIDRAIARLLGVDVSTLPLPPPTGIWCPFCKHWNRRYRGLSGWSIPGNNLRGRRALADFQSHLGKAHRAGRTP